MWTTSIRTLATSTALALLVAGGAAAQSADALFRGFEPTGDWALVVDGKEAVKAKIYDSTRAQALLIVSSEFASPVLIDRAGRTVAKATIFFGLFKHLAEEGKKSIVFSKDFMESFAIRQTIAAGTAAGASA